MTINDNSCFIIGGCLQGIWRRKETRKRIGSSLKYDCFSTTSKRLNLNNPTQGTQCGVDEFPTTQRPEGT